MNPSWDSVIYEICEGQVGHDEVKSFFFTIGLNKKGGRDWEKFEKYLFIQIFPLFPDALGNPGKRVLIKLDSGLGRINPQLMVWLCLLGFYTYPSVSNTTGVTQETNKNTVISRLNFVLVWVSVFHIGCHITSLLSFCCGLMGCLCLVEPILQLELIVMWICLLNLFEKRHPLLHGKPSHQIELIWMTAKSNDNRRVWPMQIKHK